MGVQDMGLGGGNGGVTGYLGAAGFFGIPADKFVAPCAGGRGQEIVFAAVGCCVIFCADLSACCVDLPPLASRATRHFLAVQWAYSVVGGFVPTVVVSVTFLSSPPIFRYTSRQVVAIAVGCRQWAVFFADGHRCACRADPAAVGIKSYEVRRGRDLAFGCCLIVEPAAEVARYPDAEIFGNILCISCGVDKVEAFGCGTAYGRGVIHRYLNDIGICITAANRRFYRISVWCTRIKYRRLVGGGNIPQIHYLKRSIRGRIFVGAGVRPVQRKIKRYGVGRVGGDCNRDGNFLIAQLEFFGISGVEADAYTAAGQRGTAGTRGVSGGACTIGHGVGVLPFYSVLVDLALCGNFMAGRRPPKRPPPQCRTVRTGTAQHTKSVSTASRY